MPISLGLCYEEIDDEDKTPAAVTADGGCRLSNPSPHGGMWAFRITNRAGRPIYQASGVILPADILPLTTVTNNLAEVVAILLGLEFLPDGLPILARTDSLNAIRVFMNYDDPKKVANQRIWLTPEIIARVRAVRERLGPMDFELLAGHPNLSEVERLEAGEVVKNERGYPFCVHNVWADRACCGAWENYQSQQG